MPNYPTHARWGRVGAALAAVSVGGGVFVGFDSPLLAGGGAAGAAAATFVGSVFPDIDHHESIPRRKAVRALRLLVVLGIASLAALHFETLVGLADTGLLEERQIPPEILAGASTAVVALAAVGAVEPTVDTVTGPHRGWTHSAPVMFLLTALLTGGVVLLMRDLSVARRATAAAVVGSFFLGCLVHIVLDGELR